MQKQLPDPELGNYFTAKDYIKLAILQMHKDQTKLSLGYNSYDRDAMFKRRFKQNVLQ
ncbi:MAG: hypothetical protein ACKO96_39180 [Flammeovirgaceae bacterium]